MNKGGPPNLFLVKFGWPKLGLGPHLFVKVPRPGDSEVTFSVFESSSTCYYQYNHSKVEAITLNALPKDTTSELTGLSPH